MTGAMVIGACGADSNASSPTHVAHVDDGQLESTDWWTEIERDDSGATVSDDPSSDASSEATHPADDRLEDDHLTIDPETETWVATGHEADRGVEAWSEFPTPDALSSHWFPTPTQFGGPRVFLVEEARGEFLRVSLPVQPNGTSGWIRADAVTLEMITVRAEVDLANHRLTVWDGDEVIVQTDAATGKPSTPTPIGVFYVRDVIPSGPSSAYGPFIIGLSGFSETLTTFNGGLPAIAIHGTNRPDLVGQEVSNGCVRIPNELIELLAATVPLGTPVTVVA